MALAQALVSDSSNRSQHLRQRRSRSLAHNSRFDSNLLLPQPRLASNRASAPGYVTVRDKWGSNCLDKVSSQHNPNSRLHLPRYKGNQRNNSSNKLLLHNNSSNSRRSLVL